VCTLQHSSETKQERAGWIWVAVQVALGFLVVEVPPLSKDLFQRGKFIFYSKLENTNRLLQENGFKMLFGDDFLPHLAPKLVVMDITNSCPFLVDMTVDVITWLTRRGIPYTALQSHAESIHRVKIIKLQHRIYGLDRVLQENMDKQWCYCLIPYNRLEFTWTWVKSKVPENINTCKVADVGHVTYKAIDNTDFIIAGLCKPCQKLTGRRFRVTVCQMWHAETDSHEPEGVLIWKSPVMKMVEVFILYLQYRFVSYHW